VRQATEDALGPRGHLGRAEILQPQIQPAGQRRMDHGDVRLALLPAGDRHDLRLAVAKQDLDQFQSGVAGGSEDGDACHGDRLVLAVFSGGPSPTSRKRRHCGQTMKY